jgi:uncharacterized protein (TIGR04255 family)
MDISFENPPLVELIVELRWLPPGITVGANESGQTNIPLAMFSPGKADALFMAFAGLIGGNGFVHSERLMPPGFPSVPFQPIYRYSQSGAAPGRALYQLGAGIFSIHITPPYRRWNQFRPFVESGIEKLLSARPAEERNVGFSGTLVRYLDCFTEKHTAGRSPARFLREVLGIKLELPSAVINRLVPGSEATAAMQLSVPIAANRTMSINIAQGRIGSYMGLIMDSSAASTGQLAPIVQDVMRVLDESHQVISDFFIELTEPLHAVMGRHDESKH